MQALKMKINLIQHFTLHWKSIFVFETIDTEFTILKLKLSMLQKSEKDYFILIDKIILINYLSLDNYV